MSRVMARSLTHLDRQGRVRMVNVSRKRVTARVAVARGRVFMHRDTLELLATGGGKKGDAL
ncbi:MAG: cyclic pyranopterin monophosphate synthase MoaC, partial [Gaiellaceae bacterium]